jgi:hypothetical protein
LAAIEYISLDFKPTDRYVASVIALLDFFRVFSAPRLESVTVRYIGGREAPALINIIGDNYRSLRSLELYCVDADIYFNFIHALPFITPLCLVQLGENHVLGLFPDKNPTT